MSDPQATFTEAQSALDLIWSQMPHLQNDMSSAWWFFMLLPKQENGYGPKQMMFTLASRVGREVMIKGVWHEGISTKREIKDGVDRFNTVVLGWIHDGETYHGDVVRHPVEAELSKEGYIRAWAEQDNGERYGGEISVDPERPLALKARYNGPKGSAAFDVWGSMDSRYTYPEEAINIKTPLGGAHMIAWRRANFAGEFTSPSGTEYLEGVTYFQRVSLNVPPFPWFWIWAMLEDGSLFSAYIPYVGLNFFRRKYYFYSPRLERTALPIHSNAFLDIPGRSEVKQFKKCRVTPMPNGGSYPTFMVQSEAADGDFLSFCIEPYGHTRIPMKRKLFRRTVETHYDYNEYIFRMSGLDGRVDGRSITHQTAGSGYGSLEYTWGLGL
ncbi:MAG: hypothetical protein WAM60_15425 [Candidatus Promineifilaceae bacterium]